MERNSAVLPRLQTVATAAQIQRGKNTLVPPDTDNRTNETTNLREFEI